MLTNTKTFFLKYWLSIVKIIFSLSLLLIIFILCKDELHNFKLNRTFHLIRTLPLPQLLLFYVMGLVSTSTMVSYDVIASRKLENKIPRKKLFTISYLINTLNNIFNFGGATGITLRSYLLKKNNISIRDLFKYNILIYPAVITGLSTLSFFFILNINIVKPIISSQPWLLFALILFSFYLIIYFCLDLILSKISKIKKFELKLDTFRKVEFKHRFMCFLASNIEWLSAGFTFFIIAKYVGEATSFFNILSVFCLASIAGLISLIPSGIGSFDLIAMLGLQLNGINSSNAVAILILYRLFYYLLPLFTAILNFIIRLLLDNNSITDSFYKYSKLTSIDAIVNKFKPYSNLLTTLVSLLILFSGSILLISAISPGILSRIKILAEFLPISLLQFSHRITITIGIILIIMSREIFFRVKRAYYWSIILLSSGVLFTFMKGLDYEEAIFIIITLIFLILSKPSFYRESIPYKRKMIVTLIFSTGIFLIIYLFISDKIHFNFINHRIKLFTDYTDFIRTGALTYVLFLIFLTLWIYTNKSIKNNALYESFNIEKFKYFISNYKGNCLTHLLYLDDKKVYYACNNSVLFYYSIYNEKVIVLGDPIGNDDLFSAAISEFQAFMDLYGYTPVFYQISESKLSLYHNHGYYFFKLGEEATIDLNSFTLSGNKRRGFRSTLNKFTNDEFKFEIIDPPFNTEFISELEGISHQWLGKRNEKGFSLGWFNINYLQQSPISIVRNKDNQIISFATIMPNYDENTISIDLMRFSKNAPGSTMDFLILNLLLYFKNSNYKTFNLGMAPLSNVGTLTKSHPQEKIAKLVYNYGDYFYSFGGLREYKEKFYPKWECKYLAYPNIFSIAETLLDIALLVASKKNTK